MRVIIRIIIGVIIGAVAAEGYFEIAPSADRLERSFQRNYRHIVAVRDFLEEQEQHTILLMRLTSRDVRMWIGSETIISVEDESVIAAVNALHWQGLGLVVKSDYGIVFQTRSRLMGRYITRGFVYYIDGRRPEESEAIIFLTELQPLSQAGWHVYTSDRNEFLRRFEKFITYPDLYWIEEEFEHSFEYLTVVKDFIMERDRASFILVESGLEMINIDNEKALSALHYLFSHNYIEIEKANNVIAFERWCRLKWFAYGILYAVDGSILENYHRGFRQNTVVIEPSSKAGWYFFIDDDRGWRHDF